MQKKTNNYDISLVTTVYNDEDTILALIEDVRGQSIRPAEWVIVDGGSKDRTVELIQNNCDDINIKLITGNSLNIAQGLNVGIRNTLFDYIAIVSTGNSYSNNFLEELFSALWDDFDVAYTPIKGKGSTSFAYEYINTFMDGPLGWHDSIASNHGVMIKKEVFNSIGFFLEDLFYAGEDTEYYKTVISRGYKLKLVDTCEVHWSVPESIDEMKRQTELYYIARMQLDGRIESFFVTFRPLLYLAGLCVSSLFLYKNIILALIVAGFVVVLIKLIKIVQRKKSISLLVYKRLVEMKTCIEWLGKKEFKRVRRL